MITKLNPQLPLTLYGLKRCSTCVKAVKWFEPDYSVTFIDYREHPIDPALISTWAQQVGWDKLINRSSTTWRNLADDLKHLDSPQHCLALVKEHPNLMKRPIIIQDNQLIALGFKPKP